MRGYLSKEIKEVSKKFLGREITREELRLYPYIDYCLKNFGTIDFKKINTEEHIILKDLVLEKHLEMKGEKIKVTKDFYDYMQEILWVGYVFEDKNIN